MVGKAWEWTQSVISDKVTEFNEPATIPPRSSAWKMTPRAPPHWQDLVSASEEAHQKQVSWRAHLKLLENEAQDVDDQ